jgi:hypothetical protein
MIEVINILRSREFYGCSNTIDIAKGKNEMVSTWKGFKIKLKRAWQLRRKL